MKLISNNGRLSITFYHRSKRYRRALGLDDTKKARLIAETEIIPMIQAKLREGTYLTDTIPTVSEYAQLSFAMHEKSRKPTTKEDYAGSLRLHIEPYFGSRRLDQFKPSDITLWQNRLLETLSPSRVRNVRAVLNGIFEDARRDEIIEKNPIALVRTPKLDKCDILPFTLDEARDIIDSASGYLQGFLALAIYTGMRSGEMIGLRWSDIDLERKEISIRRTIKMGRVSTPKTRESVRTIDILDDLVPYLLRQQKRTGDKKSYVFLNKHGEHIYDIKRIRDNGWKKLLAKIGLSYRTIYQLRHTFATIMVEHGEDILWVSHMLGHTDATTTLKRYAQYRKEKGRQRAQFLKAP